LGAAHTNEELQWAKSIEAQMEALVGHPRTAIRSVRSVLGSRRSDARLAPRVQAIVGLALYRAGHYAWAKAAFEKAASHHRINNSRRDLMRNLISLSLVLKSQGNLSAALYHLDEAMRLLPKRGCAGSRLRIHLNRGICLLKLGLVS
jgi:tetratricopeptide (TPR) repeat protein